MKKTIFDYSHFKDNIFLQIEQIINQAHNNKQVISIHKNVMLISLNYQHFML